jgi:hypothetical protein
MGIYFEETTDDEDAKFIKNGISNGDITKDFKWPSYDEEPAEKDIVWKPSQDGDVVINGIPGVLTDKGINYIMRCLMKEKRCTCTL